MDRLHYNVAGHCFEVLLDNKISFPSSYAPFSVDSQSAGVPMFTVSFEIANLGGINLDVVERIGSFAGDHGLTVVDRLTEGYGFYCFFRSAEGESVHCLTCSVSEDFTQIKAHILPDSRFHNYAISTCLMMMYAFSTSKCDTILIHASVVKYGGRGYVFLGKSGTGKSTHSRLWIDNFEGAELLNDDNPVLRLYEDGVEVCGSPWSGKTSCYINECYPLGGVVRLWQKPENKITELSAVRALAAILPTASTLPCVEAIQIGTLHTVEKVVKRVKFYSLECRADLEAAKLSRDTIVE